MSQMLMKLRKCCESVEFRAAVCEAMHGAGMSADLDNERFWMEVLPVVVDSTLAAMHSRGCQLAKIVPGVLGLVRIG